MTTRCAMPLPELIIDREPYPHLRTVQGVCILARGYESNDAQEYVRRANSYPRLVEALKELLKDCDADLKPMGLHPARVLLRELGESE